MMGWVQAAFLPSGNHGTQARRQSWSPGGCLLYNLTLKYSLLYEILKAMLLYEI